MSHAPAEPFPMADRVCVVTGASSGIGEETALGLAAAGAQVALVARSRERGERSLERIRRETGNEKLDLQLADLSSQAEVRRLAARLLDAYPQIHVLVNNAGIVQLKRTTTADGHERVFATNHLAYFLLTNLLLERLKASAPARIVSVASDAHKFAELDLDDLMNERRYRGMRVYGQSKGANILFTGELARRLEGSGVTANSLHPGAVSTRLGRDDNGWWAAPLTRALGLFFLTPAQGAATSLYLASSPDVEGVSGGYFAKSRPASPKPWTRDPVRAARLWEESARLTGLPASPRGSARCGV